MRGANDQTRHQQPQVPYGSYSSCGDKVYTLKFVLVGSRGVGKSRLASLFHKKQGGYPSVGMQFATRTLRYAERSSVRAQIWDTAGDFPFKSVTEAFFRGAVGAMLVYDISKRSTFDDLVRWLTLVKGNCHESVALTLVGNKSDMSSKQREVSMVEGMRFARKHGLDFLETSATQNEHVEEACRQLVMSVARYLPQEKCVWSKKRAYPLPAGWVPIPLEDGRSSGPTDENANPERYHPDTHLDEAGFAAISKRNSHDTDATVPDDMDTEAELDVDITDVDSDSDSTDAIMMPPPPRPGAPSKRLGSRRRASESAPPKPRLVSAYDGSASAQTPPAPSASAGRACRMLGGDRFDGGGDSYDGNRRHTRINSDSATTSTTTFTLSSASSASPSLPSPRPRQPSTAVTATSRAGAGPEMGRAGNGGEDGGGGLRRRSSFASPGRVSWYENIWTGERVSHRPRSPAGPSEVCVVSRVPRALHVAALRRDSGAGATRRGDAGKARGMGMEMEMVGKTSSWSFSSFTSRGYAAAAECLSKCLDP